MSLFIKSIFLTWPYYIFAILYPKSLVNLVDEVGTRHSQEMEIICGIARSLLFEWVEEIWLDDSVPG